MKDFFTGETCTRILYYGAEPGLSATSASATPSAGEPPTTPAHEN